MNFCNIASNPEPFRYSLGKSEGLVIQDEIPHQLWEFLIHAWRGQEGGAVGRKLAGCCARYVYTGILFISLNRLWGYHLVNEDSVSQRVLIIYSRSYNQLAVEQGFNPSPSDWAVPPFLTRWSLLGDSLQSPWWSQEADGRTGKGLSVPFLCLRFSVRPGLGNGEGAWCHLPLLR